MPYKSKEKERERIRAYHASHKEQIAARMKIWRHKNKQRIREYEAKNRDRLKSLRKEWWKKNSWRAAGYRTSYRQKDPDRTRAMDAARRKRYMEKRRAHNKAYKAAHREQINASQREYAKNHPEIVMDGQVRYRWKKRLNGTRLSYGLTKLLLVSQQGLCALCRCDLEVSKFHKDHIVPISKGGRHEDSNIQLLCPKCNLTKGNRT